MEIQLSAIFKIVDKESGESEGTIKPTVCLQVESEVLKTKEDYYNFVKEFAILYILQ